MYTCELERESVCVRECLYARVIIIIIKGEFYSAHSPYKVGAPGALQ